MYTKLKQQLVLGYYKTKFNTLGKVSPSLAAASAFTLFCTPYSGKPRQEVPAVFKTAEPILLTIHNIKVKGFHWLPNTPNGKKILICHGFDSSSYRFDKYITAFLQEGFGVVAFDAPGHGISDGKTINALLYTDTILEIEKSFGPFYGVVGHSLGGLAVALAAEQMQSTYKKIVLIAPATETERAITNFFQYISMQVKTRKAFESLIQSMSGHPVSWYSVTRAIQNIRFPVLWLHDKKDTVCPYEDTLAAQKLHLPNVRFAITEGLGHSNIYRNNNVQKKIVAFFAAGQYPF